MSKGSSRRPGTVPQGAWEAIFSKPKPKDKCPKCGKVADDRHVCARDKTDWSAA